MYLHQFLRFLFLIWTISVTTYFILPVVPIIESLGFILWVGKVGVVLV